jgi:hypothetical protein
MIPILMVYGKFLIIFLYISAKVSIWDMVVKLCALPLYCICESACNVSMQSTINDRVRVRIHLHREVYHTDSLQETYECLPLCILMIIIYVLNNFLLS